MSDTLEIKTQDLFQSATTFWNIPIVPGDVINVVPRTTFTVFCIGEVKARRSAAVRERGSPDAALGHRQRPGGLTDRASKKIRIKRRGADGKDTEIVVDYNRVLAGDVPDPDIQPNDVIVVKESFF